MESFFWDGWNVPSTGGCKAWKHCSSYLVISIFPSSDPNKWKIQCTLQTWNSLPWKNTNVQAAYKSISSSIKCLKTYVGKSPQKPIITWKKKGILAMASYLKHPSRRGADDGVVADQVGSFLAAFTGTFFLGSNNISNDYPWTIQKKSMNIHRWIVLNSGYKSPF